ncbi:MAG: TolC family protein [Methylotenera sp.]|nr:TolC family protein [Methylotenera sp.]
MRACPTILNSISKLITISTLAVCLPSFLTACSFQKYRSQPIDPITNTAKFESKDISSTQFLQFLLNNGYTTDRLPIQEWGLNELTYCALFFHPSLDVARAQWRAVQSAEASAAAKALPTLNGNIAHSDDSDPTKKPFAFGLSIDIPIETANKRNIRIENAQHLSQTAKLEIAQAAWQLRQNIAQTLTEYQFNQKQLNLLTSEVARRQEIVAIYEKRVSLGAASNVELSTAKLQLQTIISEQNIKQQNKLVLVSTLAKNLGLPLTKVEAMQLAGSSGKQTMPPNNQSKQLQTSALLNRLDIRIALERYATAETKLKLEIAKQYPNLVISPGYTYEFGDNLWSLGLSSLLTLLNKNKLAITEATQLREVEAAQFEALQTKVISDIHIANSLVAQAQQALLNQQLLLEQQQAYTKRTERKFAAGEIDRLESVFVKLENIAVEKNVALADFQLNIAIYQLENALQQPISTLITGEKLTIEKLEGASLRQ